MLNLSSLSRALRPLTLGHRRRIELEVEEELRFHLDMRLRENLEAGMDETEARADAERRFGNAAAIAEACLRVHAQHPVRITLRAAQAVLTLGVGIGLAVAMFLLVNAVLFKTPVSFHDDGRRVGIWWNDEGRWQAGSTVDEIRALQALDDVFEHTTYASYNHVNLLGNGEPENSRVKYVSDRYFELYGAHPVIGRPFVSLDHEPGSKPVALLSYELWQRQYSGRRDAIDDTLMIDDVPHTVVGVMPPDLPMYLDTAVYLPLDLESRNPATDRSRLMAARLHPEVSLDAAQARVDGVVQDLKGPAAGARAGVRPLQDVYASPVRGRLLGGLTLVSLLLVGVVAHVLHRRWAATAVTETDPDGNRKRARWRSTITLENVLIAGLACWIGLLLAAGGASWLARPMFGELAHMFDVEPDGRALGLTLGLGAVMMLVLGAFGSGALRLGRRRSGSRHRATAILVATEVAVALVLVLYAAPALQTAVEAATIDPGFVVDDLLTVDLATPRQEACEVRRSRMDRIVTRLEAVPGVERVTFTHAFPTQGRYWKQTFHSVERPGVRLRDVNFAVVEGDYLKTMGIPVLAGRDFRPTDDADAPDVILVNRTMAELYWPESDPIGQHLLLPHCDKEFEVIGIAGDVRQAGPGQPVPPSIYRPFSQYGGASRLTLVFRSRLDVAELSPQVLETLRALDPDLPYGTPATAAEIIGRAQEAPRFHAGWLGALAALAFGLALIDLGGLALMAVERLLRGPVPTSPLRLAGFVIRPVLSVVLAGVAFGGLAAWRLGHLDLPVLNQLAAVDTTTIVAVFVSLATIGLTMVATVSWYARSLVTAAALQDD